MKIYNYGSYGRGCILVTPGNDHPETSDFFEKKRDERFKEFKHPIQFAVKFKEGAADVPDGLGKYLIAKGYAQRTPIILSASQSATNAIAESERLKSENLALRSQLSAAKTLLAS